MKDVMKASSENKFNVISTFAGGGGSSTGYRLAGGNVLCINEFVEEARSTYRENYPETTILPDDIKELTGKDFLDAVGMEVGELDILDGSPPCSAFSVSGSGSDGWGQTKNYSDGKVVDNIEDLFFEYIRIANEIRPKVIIAENVKGLTIGDAKKYYHMITNAFEDIGYHVSSKVLDSRWHGISQTRTRVIFIAVREDVADQAGLNFMTISNIFPEPYGEKVALRDALEGLVTNSPEIEYLKGKWMNTAYYKITTINMPDDPSYVLDGYDYHPSGSSHFNVKRASMDVPAPTLTAMGCTETGAGPLHPLDQRKFTIDELKRIQSLPDDFKLTGKFSQQAERIGRMVPPLMMKRVAEEVYAKVLKPYNENM